MRAAVAIRMATITTKNWCFQDAWEPPRRRYNDDEEEEGGDEDEIEDEVDRDAEEEGGDAADNTWDKDAEEGNEVSPEDGLQDLQYFPNFYRLLRSLDSGKNSNARRGRGDVLDRHLTASKDTSSLDPEQEQRAVPVMAMLFTRMSLRLFCSPFFPPHILHPGSVHETHTRKHN